MDSGGEATDARLPAREAVVERQRRRPRHPSLNVFSFALLVLLATAGAARELDRFVLDAHELHESLAPLPVDELPLHVPHEILRDNPQLSTNPEFVEAVTRGSSQGRLSATGVRAALYAVYRVEGDGNDIGFYGLEAASPADADRLESTLRNIWALNASLKRAQVHRTDQILFVVWNAPETPAGWEAVNAALAERLTP